MALPAEKKDILYNYGDYLHWEDEIKCELIDGIIHYMSPAPSSNHQVILGELFRHISNYLHGKQCMVFVAPFDVRLPKGNEEDCNIQTIVQPDITVVCDRNKIDERGLKGTPDLIIEIVSPSTLKKDIKDKLLLYERVGVKEYWVVYPVEKMVSVFKLMDNGTYIRPDVYSEEDSIKVGIFEDLEINLKEVFWF